MIYLLNEKGAQSINEVDFSNGGFYDLAQTLLCLKKPSNFWKRRMGEPKALDVKIIDSF